MNNPVPKKFVSAVIQNADTFLGLKMARDGSWRFPGGKPKKGETGGQALIREVFEEIGISVTAVKPITSVTLFCDGEWWQGDYYLCTSYLGVPMIREHDKHVEIAWLTKDQLRDSEKVVVSNVR